MGYRSDVALVVVKNEKAPTTIPELLALAKVANANVEDSWQGYDVRLEWDDKTFIFYIEHVKWYENYPEVQCMEKLKELALETKQFSYAFSRVGEEIDDNEYIVEGECPPYDVLGINRSICIDARVNIKGE